MRLDGGAIRRTTKTHIRSTTERENRKMNRWNKSLIIQFFFDLEIFPVRFSRGLFNCYRYTTWTWCVLYCWFKNILHHTFHFPFWFINHIALHITVDSDSIWNTLSYGCLSRLDSVWAEWFCIRLQKQKKINAHLSISLN